MLEAFVRLFGGNIGTTILTPWSIGARRVTGTGGDVVSLNCFCEPLDCLGVAAVIPSSVGGECGMYLINGGAFPLCEGEGVFTCILFFGECGGVFSP